MLKWALAICSFIATLNVAAQQASPKRMNARRANAEQCINDLRNGVLLVRLSTRENAVKDMIATGRTSSAERVRTEARERNLRITQAFLEEFDFCPVLFFKASSSKALLEKRYDEVTFLRADLSVDTGFVWEPITYLIAEFGHTEPDTLSSFQNTTLEHNANGVVWSSTRYGDQGMGLGALVIRDERLFQLHRPFPFYVRTYETLRFLRPLPAVVRIMDRKLHRFHAATGSN